MKTCRLLPILAVSLVLAGCTTTSVAPANGVTAADITVVFQEPERFRDVRDSLGGFVDEGALTTLRDFLKKEAPALLQPGQKLQVTFTDIDLAGDYVLAGGGGQLDRVRVVKDIYWPRQVFTFVLTDAAGGVVKQGDRSLTDMDFLLNVIHVNSNDAFFYDTMLLKEWLRAEFKAPAAAGAAGS